MPVRRFQHRDEHHGHTHGNGRHSVQEWATRHIDDQPLGSLLAVFATGFAVGVGAVAAYCAAAGESRHHRRDQFTDRLADVLRQHLPENLLKNWRAS